MEKRRVFMLCLFALSMILSAWALPPDEKKVTLDLKDVPMETFLNTVKQKAGINMLYNSKMFKGVEPVTVKATNEPWRELLDRVLSPKGFTYATKERRIVASPSGSPNEKAPSASVMVPMFLSFPSIKTVTPGSSPPISSTTLPSKTRVF